MTLTHEQVDALLQPLDPRRVQKVQGMAHLEAWDIRRHLIRVFGWGGWDLTLLSLDCILERSFWSDKPDEPFKGRHTVVYRATYRLTIKDEAGNELAHFDDGATGDATNQPVLGDAHDMAMKTACSQALKRCAVNLGDRFGLSLYNDGGTKAVVGKSLAHTSSELEASDHVAPQEVDGGHGSAEEHDGSNGEAGSAGQPPETDTPGPRPTVDPAGSDLAARAQRMKQKAAENAPDDAKAKAASA